jgi:hypothetical protein
VVREPYDRREAKRPSPASVTTPTPGRAPRTAKLPTSAYDEIAAVLIEEAARP